MKKIISFLLVLATLFCVGLLPAHGEEQTLLYYVTFHFNTVQKGTMTEDLLDTVEVSPDYFDGDKDSIIVHTFAGHPYTGELMPGHTYYFECDYHAKPDVNLLLYTQDNIVRTAGSHVRTMWIGCQYDSLCLTSIHFINRFTVPGNPWQMITGRVVDWFGKLKSNFAL